MKENVKATGIARSFRPCTANLLIAPKTFESVLSPEPLQTLITEIEFNRYKDSSENQDTWTSLSDEYSTLFGWGKIIKWKTKKEEEGTHFPPFCLCVQNECPIRYQRKHANKLEQATFNELFRFVYRVVRLLYKLLHNPKQHIERAWTVIDK